MQTKLTTTFNIRFVTIGLLAVILGIGLYYTSRPDASAYFLHQFPFNKISPIRSFNHLGFLSHILPDYFHCLGFILITSGILNRVQSNVWICLFWVGVECLLEVFQFFGHRIAPLIPDVFSSVPYLENIRSFLIYGVFDPFDILAFILGGISAYGIMTRSISQIEKRHG